VVWSRQEIVEATLGQLDLFEQKPALIEHDGLRPLGSPPAAADILSAPLAQVA
jgi:hypothetical protein